MNIATDAWSYVSKVKAMPGNLIFLTFEDGTQGSYDMSPLLQWKVYEPLKNPNVFNEVRVMGGTATWPGDIDIAPEELYVNCVPLAQL